MINIENLSFGYKRNPVFKDISLQFKPGNIYGLLGENGAGKSTLLKIICGLLPAEKGSCVVDEFLSQDRKPATLQEIAFLPDEVTLPDDSTPLKYVNHLKVFYPHYAYGTFLHLMQELEVDPEKKFKEMSCGQQKKSLIACALSLGTKYILLDEPTNGLDIPSKAQFRSILSKRINEDCTIIISTHQVKDVENLIDPIMILSKEELLLNASIEDITRRLNFEYNGNAREDAYYSEARPGGYLNVVKNTEGAESEVNIEALFNAVLHHKNEIKELFATPAEENSIRKEAQYE